MMDDRPDDPLTKTIRDALDRSARELDGQALQRLREARRAAVSVLDGAERRRRAAWWMPAGAFAVAALAVVAFSLWGGRGGHGEATVAAIEDIDLLAAGDDAAIADDMEFYQWLALIDEAG